MYVILSRAKTPDASRLVASTFPKVHNTYEEAKAEARRLAATEVKKEFLIFHTQIGFRSLIQEPQSFVPT